MNWLLENIWLLLFIIWGLPLGYYRSKFRKLVYQTDSWTINFKPLFIKELKGLFGRLYTDDEYLKMRNFYRLYLFIYSALFIVYKVIK